MISIHALREEGDGCGIAGHAVHGDFYPRPPRGGRPRRSKAHSDDPEFLSTPSARRATKDAEHAMEVTIISIHALREEGDPSWQMSEMTGMNFYPRPPRGGRHHLSYDLNDCILFLSTPSARRATAYDLTMTYPIVDFYPRPPRGGRRAAVRQQPRGDAISIHALREEGDLELDPWCEALETFLSTPSARRATCRPLGLSVRQEFLSTPSARRATCRRSI